jgi:glucose/arabinose dehydrogenase
MWKKLVWFAGPMARCSRRPLAPASRKVPFDKGIPVAPSGLAHRPMPKLPIELDTAEGQRIRVVSVATGLESPFSIAFLPDGNMLVTTRTGQLRIIRKGVLDPKPVAGTPASYWAVESGLPGAVHGYMDIALHPQFAQNGFVYLT